MRRDDNYSSTNHFAASSTAKKKKDYPSLTQCGIWRYREVVVLSFSLSLAFFFVSDFLWSHAGGGDDVIRRVNMHRKWRVAGRPRRTTSCRGDLNPHSPRSRTSQFRRTRLPLRPRPRQLRHLWRRRRTFGSGPALKELRRWNIKPCCVAPPFYLDVIQIRRCNETNKK